MVTGAQEAASATWRVIWPMVTGLPAIRRTRRRPAQSGVWGIEGQRLIEVELQEPHQADAALRLPDHRAELLVRSARRELAE